MTDQQHDVQAPAETGLVAMPQFLPPRSLPRHDPVPEGTTLHPESTRPRGEEPTQSPEDGGDFSGEPAADPMTDGSSPASTGKPGRVVSPLVTAKQIEACQSLVGAMIHGATFLMNRRVSGGNPRDERWLVTAKQRDDIAAPLARILARRSPIPTSSEGSASDLADGIEAMAAIMAYALVQMDTPAPVGPVRVRVVPEAPAADPAPAPAPAPAAAGGAASFFTAPGGM